MANDAGLVSIKVVVDRLFRNPLLKDIQWDFIIDNAIQVMRILEAPALYIDRYETIEVKNFRALKPIDVMKITQVMRIETGGGGNQQSQLNPMRESQDTINNHLSFFPKATADRAGGNTWSQNGSYIHPNFEEGKIAIFYKAIAVDEECFPMILNNETLLRCIESYIKYRWFDILNDLDKISDRKLNKAEADYSFNVAQADANMKLPSESEMETLVNSITQILPSRIQFGERFKFLGSQEFMKIQ